MTSHLLSSIVSGNIEESKSVAKEVLRVYRLSDVDKNSDSTFAGNVLLGKEAERELFRYCIDPILGIVSHSRNIKVISLAYGVLDHFSVGLGEKSNDFLYYLERLVSCFETDIIHSEDRRMYHGKAAFHCLSSYIRNIRRKDAGATRDLMTRVNSLCFVLVTLGHRNLCFTLGALTVWKSMVEHIRGSSNAAFLNLPLVFAQVQRMAWHDGEDSVRVAAREALSAMRDMYKDVAEFDEEEVVDSDDSFMNLEDVDEFEMEAETKEIEYFLRGSIRPPNNHLSPDKMGRVLIPGSTSEFENEALKVKLAEAIRVVENSFSNRELSFIERAIQEGVDSQESNSTFSTLECIFSRFLEIIYEELINSAKKSIQADELPMEKHVDKMTSVVLAQANDLESRFLRLVVPCFTDILGLH